MNIYEKLNEARIRFQSANIKKSGKNGYAGYTYYELADILPYVNQLAKELKFSCIIDFEKESAILRIIDVEKPEDFILFSTPMSEASLKGCHAVQNLGAVETYLKRYLYQNAFEIVEADVLDMTMNPEQDKEEKNASKSNRNVTKSDTEVDKLIEECSKLIQYTDLDDKQIECITKAIAEKDVKVMKAVLYRVNQKKNSNAVNQ